MSQFNVTFRKNVRSQKCDNILSHSAAKCDNSNFEENTNIGTLWTMIWTIQNEFW